MLELYSHPLLYVVEHELMLLKDDNNNNKQPNIIALSGVDYMDRNTSYSFIINHI